MKALRALLLLLAAAPALAARADSIYVLQAPLTAQDGTATQLDAHRGSPVLISMFYGSCPHVCPMLIATVQRLERELTAEQRGRLRVLLVSLDPERDTPARLAEIAQRHGVDTSRWTLARTDAAHVRKIAVMLGIQYRGLPDGEFNHSTVITLLDREGRIRGQTSKLLKLDEEFMASLRAISP